MPQRALKTTKDWRLEPVFFLRNKMNMDTPTMTINTTVAIPP